MSLSQGDHLGRYEVLGPIGAGGMGEVWRARDTELDREVAVKVLPESFASDANRLERFQREAKALAALSHPNLLDIYDVGTTDGLHYAVTELLEGDTLRERITPSGLPWKKVTSIGAAVADGLAAAHGRGIIHRDLKPENLFLTADGRVKILDFGLASVHEEADSNAETATITEAGTVMGTPGYMAPEQVKGKPADTRSDIFSLGCVIYEMASGHRAFRGETGVEVIANILKEEPPQLSSSGASVPVDLERAVHRCLEKRPEARFQSAADLAYSLKSVGTSGTAPVMAKPETITSVQKRMWPPLRIGAAVVLVVAAVISSWWALTDRGAGPTTATAPEPVANRVAVLPFQTSGDDPRLQGVSLAAVNQVLNQLSEYSGSLRISYTNVVAQPEFMELDIINAAGVTPPSGRTDNATESATAAALDRRAATSVSGFVYMDGPEGVVQGSVTDTITGEMVSTWSARWVEGEAPSIAVNEVAERLAISVVAHLHWMHLDWAAQHPPNPDAFRAFISGTNRVYVGDTGAEASLMKAIQLEPDWARPKLIAVWGFKYLGRRERARELCEAVIATDNLNPLDELLAKYFLSDLGGWYTNSLNQAYAAHQLAPRHTHLTRWVGRAAIKCNRPEFAVEILETIPLERLDPRTATELAAALHLLGEYDRELELWEQLAHLRPNPGDWFYHRGLIAPLGAMGRVDEIKKYLNEWQNLPGSGYSFAFQTLLACSELLAHGYVDQVSPLAVSGLDWIETSGTLDLNRPETAQVRSAFLDLLGRSDEAKAVMKDSWESAPDTWETWSEQGIIAARAGDEGTARAMADRLAEVDEPDVYGGPVYARACIEARLGDTTESLRLLKKALSEGHEYGTELHRDRDLEPLWDNPEFQEILRPKG